MNMPADKTPTMWGITPASADEGQRPFDRPSRLTQALIRVSVVWLIVALIFWAWYLAAIQFIPQLLYPYLWLGLVGLPVWIWRRPLARQLQTWRFTGFLKFMALGYLMVLIEEIFAALVNHLTEKGQKAPSFKAGMNAHAAGRTTVLASILCDGGKTMNKEDQEASDALQADGDPVRRASPRLAWPLSGDARAVPGVARGGGTAVDRSGGVAHPGARAGAVALGRGVRACRRSARSSPPTWRRRPRCGARNSAKRG